MDRDELLQKVNDARAKLDRVVNDQTTIAERLVAENRSATDSEDDRLSALQLGEVRAREQLRQLEAALRAMDGVASGRGASFTEGHDAGTNRPRSADRGTDSSLASHRLDTFPLGGDVRGAALRAIEQAPGATDEQRQVATLLVERDQTFMAARWASASASTDYLRAFAKLVQDPQRGHLEFTTAEQQAFARARYEARAMSLTDAAGGYMVPFALDPSIMLTSDGSVDPIRQLARVVSTVSESWNGVTSAGVATRWGAEASEVNDDAPTLDTAPIPVHKADSFVPYSIEVGGDAIDLVNELRRIMVDAKAHHEAAAWINGTGSDQPTGIVTALDGGTSEVDPATAETFAAADIYATLEALPARFRGNAAWLAELATINTIDQFETTNGAKQFPEVNAATATLLRRRLYEVSEMDGVSGINAAATADNHVLAVGDLRAGYVIVDRIGTTIELIPHIMGANNRPTGQRGLYMYWRVGADVVVPEAVRLLNVATVA